MLQVKLNPSLANTWLCLGKCIWKKEGLASTKKPTSYKISLLEFQLNLSLYIDVILWLIALCHIQSSIKEMLYQLSIAEIKMA